MLQYLIPRFPLRDLRPMLLVSLCGAMVAGGYGIVHDQITYSISTEYFTKLKFDQFRYADWGLGDRVFAGVIGFLASWWVGAIAAWFAARWHLPYRNRSIAMRQIRRSFLLVGCVAITSATIGWAYGLWLGPRADYSSWDDVFSQLGIEQHWAFVRVAYIHNASYLGSLLGLLLALLVLRRAEPTQVENELAPPQPMREKLGSAENQWKPKA